MADDFSRAWVLPKESVREWAPADARRGEPLWLRDVSAPEGLPRFVLLDDERRIASPEECIRRHGDLLKHPRSFVMVLESDDEHYYEIVDWPLDFRKSVRRLVYCVTLMRVPWSATS